MPVPGYRSAWVVEGCIAHRTAETPSSALPICRTCICDVPSGIVASRASRNNRSATLPSMSPVLRGDGHGIEHDVAAADRPDGQLRPGLGPVSARLPLDEEGRDPPGAEAGIHGGEHH